MKTITETIRYEIEDIANVKFFRVKEAHGTDFKPLTFISKQCRIACKQTEKALEKDDYESAKYHAIEKSVWLEMLRTYKVAHGIA